MKALRGIAAQRNGRVEQQVEPVKHLLNARTALRPNRAVICTARQHALHRVDDIGEVRARRRSFKMEWFVGKEMSSAHFRQYIALTHIGASSCRQPLGEPAGGLDAIEVHVGTRTDQVAETVVPMPNRSISSKLRDPSGKSEMIGGVGSHPSDFHHEQLFG
jgi:hypothetical protein